MTYFFLLYLLLLFFFFDFLNLFLSELAYLSRIICQLFLLIRQILENRFGWRNNSLATFAHIDFCGSGWLSCDSGLSRCCCSSIIHFRNITSLVHQFFALLFFSGLFETFFLFYMSFIMSFRSNILLIIRSHRYISRQFRSESAFFLISFEFIILFTLISLFVTRLSFLIKPINCILLILV